MAYIIVVALGARLLCGSVGCECYAFRVPCVRVCVCVCDVHAPVDTTVNSLSQSKRSKNVTVTRGGVALQVESTSDLLRMSRNKKAQRGTAVLF